MPRLLSTPSTVLEQSIVKTSEPRKRIFTVRDTELAGYALKIWPLAFEVGHSGKRGVAHQSSDSTGRFSCRKHARSDVASFSSLCIALP